MKKRLLLAATVAAATGTVAMLPLGDATAHSSCGNGRFLGLDADNVTSRVYRARPPHSRSATWFYGCAYSVNRSFKLGDSDEPVLKDTIRFGGRYVGFAQEQETDLDKYEGVRVVDLRTGAHRFETTFQSPANNNDNVDLDQNDITDLDMTRFGGVAWIEAFDTVTDGKATRTYNVRKLDGTEPEGERREGTLLDSGTEIDPDSLAESGETFYWTKAGAARSYQAAQR